MKTTSTSRIITVLTLLGALAPVTHGAEVEFGVTVGISHSDNVYLDSSPNEVDDMIYRASPSLMLTHASPSLDANLRYRFEYFQYDDTDTSQSHHMGEGSLIGKLFNEALQLEIGASRRQAIRDQDDRIPSGRLPLSGNLVDSDEVYVHPRLESMLGRSVALNVGYRYAEGSYDDSELQDDDNHHATFSLDNYAARGGLTWALRYDRRKTEYDLSPEWEHQIASAELGFWVNAKLRLFASGGEESPWDEPFNSDLEDSFWETGFAYASGDNLTAEFAAGERSFGTSWRGSLEYTFNRGSTSFSYNESPTTTGFNNSGGRQRVVLDPDDLDEFLDTPGQGERYLSERLNWSLNLDFRRTSFNLVLFDEDRSGRIQTDGTPLGDEEQRGASASFNWKAGARTTFVLSGSFVERDKDLTGGSDYRRAGFGINYSLGRRSQLSLDYSYDEQEPDSDASSIDYEANVISLFFTVTM